MKITSLLALSLGALTASPALAQATRIWISGVGDDANPCSRTAPCLTIAGSLSKVVAGGEIDILDPVGLGSFTLTKSLTIDGSAAHLGLQSPSTNGIVVNAGVNDSVTLRGLTIEALQSGTSGVQFVSGKALRVEKCSVNSFTSAGIDFSPAGGGSLFVLDSSVRGSEVGVKVESSGGRALAALSQVTLARNVKGLAVGRGGFVTGSTLRAQQNDAAGLWLQTDGGSAEINVEGASITDNALGVRTEAPEGNAVIRLSNALVAGNAVAPTQAAGAGVVHSFGNNRIIGGSAPGCGSDAGLSIAPTTLPLGVAGVAYSATELVSTGAVGVTTWAAPGLPTGLAITEGVVRGTPSVAGHFTFALSFTDGNGCSKNDNATLEVACPMATLAPSTLAGATTGVPFATTFTLTGTNSSQREWVLSGALPVGISFTDGLLSGTPTQPGDFALTVAVRDGYGCSSSENVVLRVVRGPSYQDTTLSLASSANPSWVGLPVTLTATISGATSPTGTVTFFEGATVLATAPVSNAVATSPLASLAVGTHFITATYSGDATAGASFASAFTQVIALAPTATSVIQRSESEFEVAVTSDAGVAAGSVTLHIDGTDGGTATLDVVGKASFSASLAPGAHDLVATFAENDRFAGSTSPLLHVQVASPGDGGAADAGGTDAGPTDAGMQSDAGSPSLDAGDGPSTKSGCGCGAVEGAWSSLCGLVLLALRRRRSMSS